MRLLIAIVCLIALVGLVAQLRAGASTFADATAVAESAAPLIVGTNWLWWEPVSVVFAVGGALAMVLWRVAYRMRLI